MRTGRPKTPLILSKDETEQLLSFSRSLTLPAGLVRRAKSILLAAEGLSDGAIALKVGFCRQVVGTWRNRFIERRIPGLYDELRPGAPRSIDDDMIADLIRKTLETPPPDGSTHWVVRSMAQASGISRSSVHRIWQAFHIHPDRQETFQLSSDPFFIEKVRDIVGLYLHPPTKALVLCVDEKSQIQALERTQPMLPVGCGYVEGITHCYKRHGTTTLFAAFNIATGDVLTDCQEHHRHEEYLAFLKEIDANVPPELDIHLVVDNLATHKHQQIKQWLGEHQRFQVHFTPTYASWLNQVEIWFNIITRRVIRRGSFKTVQELIGKIDDFVRHWNQHPHPFCWVATADSILQKVSRLCHDISETAH